MNTARDLPPVNIVLDQPELIALRSRMGREAVLNVVRAVIGEARRRVNLGEVVNLDPATLARQASGQLQAVRSGLRPVINATGILLHTGLGRAPLARKAIEAVAEVARGYCNLEFDLERGERGHRTSHVSELLRRLSGAEAATVVNNNAGATVLALRALALGREVIVSRGQLIEIGGSFRLPDIFEVSGAKLVEVGTTNRTRIGDYERAITPRTAVLLRVHPSNYKVVGFTESVDIAELAMLAKAKGLKSIDDIGSGALKQGMPPGVSGEPTVAEGLAAGADLILGSGDKLLGGPQCGLLVGTREAIKQVETDPLMRALRVDKMTLAALEATLHLLFDPEIAARQIPLWAFLSTPLEAIRERAEILARVFRSEMHLNAGVIETTAFLGGGSIPQEPIPTFAVRLDAPWPAGIASEGAFAKALRLGNPSVVLRIQGGGVLFDLRAVDPSQDSILRECVRKLCGTGISM